MVNCVPLITFAPFKEILKNANAYEMSFSNSYDLWMKCVDLFLFSSK
jgi:hypothetical protein